MNRSEIEHYRAMLVAKEAELANRRAGREEIAIEKSADAMDEVQSLCARELAVSNLDREARLLQAIRSALARVDDGSFGLCLRCDKEIDLARLNAVPWAPLCIDCQEKADRREAKSEIESSTNELRAA